MLVKCGWEMNWRNDPHICWTIPAIFSYVHLKNFQVSSTWFEPMTSAMPAQCSNQLRCSQMWAGQFDNRCDCPASVRVISSINLTLTWNFSSAGRLMYSDLNEGPLTFFRDARMSILLFPDSWICFLRPQEFGFRFFMIREVYIYLDVIREPAICERLIIPIFGNFSLI